MTRNVWDKRAVHIAGVAETALGEVRDQTELSMFAAAAREALGEAGLTLRDVDGVFVNYMGEEGSVQVAEYLGITAPRYADSTDLGGAAFEAFVHHAMLAVAEGRCEVALIGYASRQRTRRFRNMAGSPVDADSLAAQFQSPYGLPAPIGHYAMMAARHMHAYGTTPEQLAEVAVAARAWARLNPKAWSRDPLNVEQALASRMISTPLRRSDCCLVTDGGGAIVVTTAERARDAAKPSVRVIGAGESHTHWHLASMPDLTVTAGAVSGGEAFAMAGITAADVDVLQPYDSFTITVLLALEDLGFCGKGEGGPFVSGGRLAPGGALPAMTSGGGLSYNHPGALGALLLVEAVRQLRGEAGERQVPDARIAVAHGVGGFNSTAATVVLAR
ncbi:thiolase [Spongiactinospora gelatinilytica]|uniref:Thiolase n=1 Tax=Spongiactinospora gelatinilytica TaxID=2666298 RepID=A0A2W2FZF3_9ACTN|nr:acetyl-CoA acetyltransferase [Spongiactinospora gelatinilytica]PZG41052.1 thiolase [Spongiactinospora gelatinilytica]